MSASRSQPTLLGFFGKKSGTEPDNIVHENGSAEASDHRVAQASNVDENETSVSTAVAVKDIGHYISTGKRPDDRTLYQVLTDHWKPPAGYQFPFSVHSKRGKAEKRYFKREHLENFQWAVFSEKDQGMYCLYCPFFASETGGGQKRVTLEKLVRKPLVSFAKLLGKDGDLIKHSGAYYHLAATEKAKLFIQTTLETSLRVDNLLESNRRNQVLLNRARLSSIMKAIFFLGRQNVPLRGHRDSGRVDPSSTSAVADPNNEGNFRELLKLMADSGDSVRMEHLETSASNAMYTSSVSQNNIIQCIGEEFQHRILKAIRSCGPFSIMFDETTDLSHTNILSFVVRYVDTSGSKFSIREDFLDFINTYAAAAEQNAEAGMPPNAENCLTGVKLGSLGVSMMKNFRLDLHSCVGIGTDGCSVMTSDSRGAISAIKEEATLAERCHCHSHDLNLSLEKSSRLPQVRNTLNMLQEVVSFFSLSAKRNEVLVRVAGGKLKAVCQTRWVEKYQAIADFTDKYTKIVQTLEDIGEWEDQCSSTKANLLVGALARFECVIIVHILKDLFSSTVPVSAALKRRQLDLPQAAEMMKDTIVLLKDKRENAATSFAGILASSTTVANEIEIPVAMPRKASRQMHRSNHGVTSLEQFYRVSVYIPLLDEIINDLDSRSKVDESAALFRLSQLIPNVVVSLADQDITSAVVALHSKYKKLLMQVDETMLRNEVLLWKNKWKRTPEAPSDVLSSLDAANSDIYPSVHSLLRVLAVLPVTVASAERSFSTLRRLKTYLRTTMTENRLTGLALMNIHRDIKVDIESVVDRFGAKQDRRMKLLL